MLQRTLTALVTSALLGAVLLITPATTTATASVVSPISSTFSAGDDQACGLTTTGAAYCWGYNAQGQLGDGTTNHSDENGPQAVIGGLTFASISVGYGHACALTPAGIAYCWGDNAQGQLGDGTSGTNRLTPTAVIGGLTFASISAGSDHTCALTTAGIAYCWGDNAEGQLGDGTTVDKSTPTAVIGGLTFASITLGSTSYTSCGLTAASAAYCWGDNAQGQLGDGTTVDKSTPTAVIGGLTFASITSGWERTCALTSQGAAYCWGYNGYGALGDGTTVGKITPTAVIGGFKFAAIDSGDDTMCAVTFTGEGYCWGEDEDGNVGDGSVGDIDVTEPHLVIGGHAWMLPGGSTNCGTLDSTVCPTITDAGSRKLIGAPGSAAMSTPARYTWLNCRVAGAGTTSRPSDCRPGKTVTSTGARFSRMAYRISLADRRSGYLRLAVQVRGTTYYSGTFDVRP